MVKMEIKFLLSLRGNNWNDTFNMMNNLKTIATSFHRKQKLKAIKILDFIE